MSDLFHRLITVLIGYGRLVRGINFDLRTNTFMRFLVAGGVNTLFGFAVYSVAVIAGAAVWLALLIGTVAGTVFNFFTTGGYVFRELSPARFPRFVICYLLVYGVNLGLLELLSMWMSEKTLSQLILMFPMAVLSYFLMARFVFQRSRPPSSLKNKS